MKIKFSDALGIFTLVRDLNAKEIADIAVTKIYLKTLAVARQFDDAKLKAEEDQKPIIEKYQKEVASLSEDEKKIQSADIEKRFSEEINSLVSVKALKELPESVVDLDIPTISEELYYKIAGTLKKVGDSYPLVQLIGNK